MEFYPIPEEHVALPEEYAVPAEPRDPPAEEFAPRRPSSGSQIGSRHDRLKRMMLLPVAAAVAATSLLLAAAGADPLAEGGHHKGEDHPIVNPSEPEREDRDVIHVTYVPTGESESFDGEDALTDAKAWVFDRGGDPDSLRYLREEQFLVDTIYSDDCIIVGDPDDMEHAYIAQGTVTYVYRRDIYYEAYGDDAFPTLPNLDPDFAGDYAWSGQGSEEYVRVLLPGESDYTYLQMGSVWADMGGREGDIPGASYDRATNTLTLENFYGDILDANLMGNGFTIRLIGQNRLEMLMVWGAGYGGSVTFIGDGSLTIDGGQEPAIRLNAEGSQSCLMVDRGVTVEARSESAAVVILDTMIDPAIYCRTGVTVSGGMPAVLDQAEGDNGDRYYVYSVMDDDGNPATYVRFGGNA